MKKQLDILMRVVTFILSIYFIATEIESCEEGDSALKVRKDVKNIVKESRQQLPIRINGTVWDGIDQDDLTVSYFYKYDTEPFNKTETLVALNTLKVQSANLMCADASTLAGYQYIYHFRDVNDHEFMNYVINTYTCKKITEEQFHLKKLEKKGEYHFPVSNSLNYKLSLADIGFIASNYTPNMKEDLALFQRQDIERNGNVEFPESFLEVEPASQKQMKKAIVED